MPKNILFRIIFQCQNFFFDFMSVEKKFELLRIQSISFETWLHQTSVVDPFHLPSRVDTSSISHKCYSCCSDYSWQPARNRWMHRSGRPVTEDKIYDEHKQHRLHLVGWQSSSDFWWHPPRNHSQGSSEFATSLPSGVSQLHPHRSKLHDGGAAPQISYNPLKTCSNEVIFISSLRNL